MPDNYSLKKLCEVCDKPIPNEFSNLLCMEHYVTQTKEIEQKKKDEKEDKKVEESKTPDLDEKDRQIEEKIKTVDIEEPEYIDPDEVSIRELYAESKKDEEPKEMGEPASVKPDSSITDPDYRENPEAPDKDQIIANIAQFVKTDILLYQHQKSMYTFVKNYMMQKSQAHAQFSKHIWKPKVVDVGCGSGVGTNILSQEADFAWGIDKNKKSISFAKQAFTREKNGIYYTPQVMFDVFDILENDFEVEKFDIVVAIEIIEHIHDWRTFMSKMITNFTKKNKSGQYEDIEHSGPNGMFYNGTEFFISTPNRNSNRISDVRPKNIFHCREYTSQEFYNAMSEYFHKVKLYAWTGEEVDVNTLHTPIFAVARKPK